MGRMRSDVREHLAAERTLLAYTRTSLAITGLGFIVARFSLFLRELGLLRTGNQVQGPGLSIWFGVALVLFAIILNVLSTLEYRRLIRRLNSGTEAGWPESRLAIGTSLLLTLAGAALAGYLVWLR
jgi:putative membrane protein